MTSVYFPKEGHEFTASLNKARKDMSEYHIPLKMRFDGTKTVLLLNFLQYVNQGLLPKFTRNSSIYEGIRAALQLPYCIAYINEGVNLRSLQMHDRSKLLNYIQKSIHISSVISSSISNLSNLNAVQNNNVVCGNAQLLQPQSSTAGSTTIL
jgi:hypothetical protein